MIPPVVQPGDEFQRVRMPNTAGTVGKLLRIASVSGDLAQLEWSDALSLPDAYAQTTDPMVVGQVWNDGGHLVFSAGVGPLYGIGSAAIGSTFIVG